MRAGTYNKQAVVEIDSDGTEACKGWNTVGMAVDARCRSLAGRGTAVGAATRSGSPRWLVQAGRDGEAARILCGWLEASAVADELAAIREQSPKGRTLEEDASSWAIYAGGPSDLRGTSTTGSR